jgi:RNA polymerase sigma-70 factor (ECF subfamily)
MTMAPLTFAFQTVPQSPYDTGRRKPVFAPTAAPMDDCPVDSTFDLVERVKSGDRQALDLLFARYLPALRRWARGRLPQWTRDLMDTDDLVQETVIRAVKRIDRFESRHEGALQAYLRQAVVNRIRDEVRRNQRSPAPAPIDTREPDRGASPLELAIGREAVERYEAALVRLKPAEREAIVARVEMGYSYEQLADALGKPSADAARMAVSRALVRLAEELNHRDA